MRCFINSTLKSWLSLSTSGAKRQRVVDRCKGVCIVKIQNLRAVKAKLSKIVKELPSEKSVVITKKWSPLCGTFSRNGRNGSRKHVTCPAKRFLAIAGPRTQGGREERLHPTRRSSGLTRICTLSLPTAAYASSLSS